jgi:hypothetical protein
MKPLAQQKEPYITEEQFNQMVVERNVANPEDDSKGDSAIDETVEAELGLENTDLDEIEEEDRGHTSTDTDEEKITEQISNKSHKGSSTWPDPADISA